MSGLVDEQAAPEPNDKPAIWDLVIADMQARDRVGRKRYGTPLQAGNGRDALVDAYQETMTPAELAALEKLLSAIRASIAKGPEVPRRARGRARPRPVVKLPEGVSPAELDRARRELEGR